MSCVRSISVTPGAMPRMTPFITPTLPSAAPKSVSSATAGAWAVARAMGGVEAELALDMGRRLFDEPAVEAHNARTPVGDGARDFELDHAANWNGDVITAHDTGLSMHLWVVSARDHTADVRLLHAGEHGGQPRLFRDDGALDDHAPLLSSAS